MIWCFFVADTLEVANRGSLGILRVRLAKETGLDCLGIHLTTFGVVDW